jgi:hypothetical protein
VIITVRRGACRLVAWDSRGELVATILHRDYLPRAIAGDLASRSGGFAVE